MRLTMGVNGSIKWKVFCFGKIILKDRIKCHFLSTMFIYTISKRDLVFQDISTPLICECTNERNAYSIFIIAQN